MSNNLVKQVGGFENAWVAVRVEAGFGQRSEVEEEEKCTDGDKGEEVEPDDAPG